MVKYNSQKFQGNSKNWSSLMKLEIQSKSLPLHYRFKNRSKRAYVHFCLKISIIIKIGFHQRNSNHTIKNFGIMHLCPFTNSPKSFMRFPLEQSYVISISNNPLIQLNMTEWGVTCHIQIFSIIQNSKCPYHHQPGSCWRTNSFCDFFLRMWGGRSIFDSGA